MNNKKGFTLIEILGAVTILGILSIVAVTSISKVIDRNKKEYYETTKKNIVNTTQSYLQTNRNQLPKQVGSKSKILLRDLISSNYIDEIEDYNKNLCDQERSYIQVYKYSKTDYNYLVYLDCPDYNNKETNNLMKPIINIELTGDSDNVSKTEAKIKIEDQNKLLSYKISILKDSKEIYNISKQANYEKVINITKDISKYTPGNIKVVVEAINIYGNKSTLVKEKTYKDKKAPVCVISNEDKDNNREWTSGSRTITVGCDDGEEGVGCTREKFTKTFKESTDKGFITIKDKAGNETKCPVVVHIDKIKPTCSVTFDGTKGDNNWFKSDVNVKLSIKDKESGAAANGLTTSSSTTYNGTITGKQTSETAGQTWYGYVKDKAGNTATCSSSLKMDKTNPTCSVSKTGTLGNNDWYRSDVSLKLSGSDNLSGLAGQGLTTSTSPTYNSKTTSSQTSETSNTAWYGYVKDKAGNTGKCNTSVKIDKTKPTCTISLSGTPGNDSWYVSNVGLKLNYSDGLSGIDKKSLTTSNDHEYYNNSENDTDTRDGSDLKWNGYVKDKAGNVSSCNTAFKADKTPPSKPTAGNLTISGNKPQAKPDAAIGSTDSMSGLKEYKYLVTNSSTPPLKTDSKFSSTGEFTRACGKSYYAWAIAIDKAGNISEPHLMGTDSDGPDELEAWSACSDICINDGGKQTAKNKCLLKPEASQSCGEKCYSACLIGNSWIYDTSRPSSVENNSIGVVYYKQKLRLLQQRGYYSEIEVLTKDDDERHPTLNVGRTGWIANICIEEYGKGCRYDCIP